MTNTGCLWKNSLTSLFFKDIYVNSHTLLNMITLDMLCRVRAELDYPLMFAHQPKAAHIDCLLIYLMQCGSEWNFVSKAARKKLVMPVWNQGDVLCMSYKCTRRLILIPIVNKFHIINRAQSIFLKGNLNFPELLQFLRTMLNFWLKFIL